MLQVYARNEEAMSTEQQEENSYFSVDPKMEEIKPLHKSWMFWVIIGISIALPAVSAHCIYPFQYWNATVLENASELFKSSIVIGGMCVSILTTFSLAYRSMETNRQIEISTIQYRNTILEPIRKNHTDLITELHSAIIHVMRIRDRLYFIEHILSKYVDTPDDSQTIPLISTIHYKTVLINNIQEIKNLSANIFYNHPRAIAYAKNNIIAKFDASVVNISSMLITLEYTNSENLSSLFSFMKGEFDKNFTENLHSEFRKTEEQHRQELSSIKREWL